MASALIPLADGVEEMEAVIMIDTLRRAKWDVVAAAVDALEVKASRGVRLLADALWQDVSPADFDVLLIPGGAGGTAVLAKHAGVLEAVRVFAAAGRLVGAVCAGPLVLQAAGVLDGVRATCHPGVRGELAKARACDDRVVLDHRIVTSQAPGTTFEFALAVIEAIDGRPARDRVAAGLVLPPGL